MPTKHRNIIRIASNYARMFGTFVLGLWLVRLLLSLGNEAYSVILLLGACHGLSAILKDMARASVIPSLAAAQYEFGGKRFIEVFNAAIVTCSGAALVTAFFYFATVYAVSWMDIPPPLLLAARIYLTCKGIQSCATIVLSPWFHMYAVSERMSAYNFWLLMERVCEISAALVLLALIPIENNTSVIVWYGVLSSMLCLAVIMVATAIILMRDRRLMPAPRRATARAFRSLLRSGVSNSTVVLANNLYFRADALLVNAYFGLFGNLVFGIARQFVQYLRQFAMGLVAGLDAVAARVDNSIQRRRAAAFVRQTVSLQGFVVFPATVILFSFTPQLIKLWLGQRLEDPDGTIPALVLMTRLLLPGIAARGLGEAWIGILSGMRRLRGFSLIILISAIANPVLVVVLIKTLPHSSAFAAPAFAYSPLAVAVYLVAAPILVKESLGLRYRDTMLPAFRPLAAAVLSCPALAAIDGATASSLVAKTAIYMATYLILCFALVLNGDQRRWLYHRLNAASFQSIRVLTRILKLVQVNKT